MADADLLDAGVVFGTGFAPFRGGPLQYSCRETGAAGLERPEAAPGPTSRPMPADYAGPALGVMSPKNTRGVGPSFTSPWEWPALHRYRSPGPTGKVRPSRTPWPVPSRIR